MYKRPSGKVGHRPLVCGPEAEGGIETVRLALATLARDRGKHRPIRVDGWRDQDRELELELEFASDSGREFKSELKFNGKYNKLAAICSPQANVDDQSLELKTSFAHASRNSSNNNKPSHATPLPASPEGTSQRRRRRRRKSKKTAVPMPLLTLPTLANKTPPSPPLDLPTKARALIPVLLGLSMLLLRFNQVEGASEQMIRLKVGALLEESGNAEQANMFIRTIKMINERKDETIRQLLKISAARDAKLRDSAPPGTGLLGLGQPNHVEPATTFSNNNNHHHHHQVFSSALISSSDEGGVQSPDGSQVASSLEASTDDGSSSPHTAGALRYLRLADEELDSPPLLAASGERQIRQTRQVAQVKLEPMIEFLSDRESSLEADGKVCQLIEAGVQAIIGPIDGASIQHVQSICDNMEIPYFELRPFLGSPSTFLSSNTNSAPTTKPSSQHQHQHQREQPPQANTGASAGAGAGVNLQQREREQNRLEDLTLNLYPPTHLLTSAYIDLIYAWNWTSFAIVYEDGSSMIKLQDLFRESSGTWTSRWKIRLFQFEGNQPVSKHDPAPHWAENGNTTSSRRPPDPLALHSESNRARKNSANGKKSTFREIFWNIRLSGEQNILLDVKTENLYEALKQAQQVGCMTERYSFLITSLDLQTLDLEDFKYSKTRITAFSILQVEKPWRLTDSEGIIAHNRGTGDSDDKLDLVRVAPDNQTVASEESSSNHNGEASFDERYLEQLGVVTQQSTSLNLNQQQIWHNGKNGGNAANGVDHRAQNGAKLPPKYKLSPSVVLDKTGAYMEPPSEVFRQQDWSRRHDQLLSSPASMSLLPSVDRDSEQKLFEFLIEQQERQISRPRLTTSSAVLHDSLILYLLGLTELDPNGQLLEDSHRQSQQTCSLNSQPLLHGSSLVNYMRRTSFTGLTGPISFDQRGLRTNIRLDMIGIAPDIGIVKVGEWHSGRTSSRHPQAMAGGVGTGEKQQQQQQAPEGQVGASNDGLLTSSFEEQSLAHEVRLREYKKQLADGAKVVQINYNKQMSQNGALQVNEIIYEHLYREQSGQVDTLIVATKLSQPYFMLKETPNKLVGNDQYEGFAVDLIHELSKLVNFQYRWLEAPDKKYGSREMLPNGSITWNGIIGEVVKGRADLGIVDLTITSSREEAVDFTLPFMNTGISILFKKPTTKATTLFSFLSPFSSDVWAYVLAAYCGISTVLFLVGHLSPYEWDDPHPCQHSRSQDDDSQAILRNQFSLLNAFWFTIGSLMQQGSDLTPRSMSTRTIAGIWYFFTLIMISSYTANLAAFLTVEKVVYPIENVKDLSEQTAIKYGCVESGSTCTFFHDSQIDTYKRINDTMHRFKTYVKSNDDGQRLVELGQFAYFAESTSIEYIIERNCNLTQIGGLLDSKGYGIATSKRSRLKRPYRTLLSEGILHLQETGQLHVLKNRWWKERRGGGTCTDDTKGGGVTELSLANVGGVFVVLLGGLGISFLVAIAEFMWRAKRSGLSRDKMCEEMINSLKFALACKRSMKPVTPGSGKSLLSKAANGRMGFGAANADNADKVAAEGVSTRTNKRLIRKRDKVGQQQQQQQQVSMDEVDKQQCDNSTLLQTMLTMLMQNQQQQQQYLYQQRQMSGAINGKQQVQSGTFDEYYQRHNHLQQQQQQQQHPSSGGLFENVNHAPVQTGTGTGALPARPDHEDQEHNQWAAAAAATTTTTTNTYNNGGGGIFGSGMNKRERQPVLLSNDTAARSRFRWFTGNTGSSTINQSANQSQSTSRSAASQRRLLFAQQTVESSAVDEDDVFDSFLPPTKAKANANANANNINNSTAHLPCEDVGQ